MALELIVEADGASRGNPGPASYGALVVDAASGEVLAELAEPIGEETNNVAEYRGLIAGLRTAQAIDPDAEVEVRMDSKLAVQQMSGKWQIKHPAIRPLAIEAREAFRKAGNVTYVWVPREQNKRADALANLALDKPAEAAAKTEAALAWRRAADQRVAGDSDPGPPARPLRFASEADALPGMDSTADMAGGGMADQVYEVAAGDTSMDAGRRVPGARVNEASAGDTSADAGRRAQAAGGASADVDRRASGGGVDQANQVSAAQAPSAGWAQPDLGPPTTLILLRHGATPLTAEKRFSGAGDPELADSGLAQAAAVARRLAAKGGIDAIVSSPSRRTRQTADAAARALGLDVGIDEGFREADFGLWDGYSFAEVRERWPAELAAWLASTSVAPPGGESFDAVAERVRLAGERLLARHARQTVLLISHVTPIKTLIREALGAPPEALYAMELSAASLSVVCYYGDGRTSMRLFNDTSHLDG